ncbi:hypothetical protein NM688_g8743 [Phlebia brevispora]|uniref:Uncharacterized protein n=1 Tax=Phlebia brevispora TaxID=194682 RepID=A0ACC1RQ74_9APHY|nr:hypothetical protein NM688_g8743 [Phlebia brevispora]
MQTNIVPRETSPSPSFRERQRAMKAHTMPIVPSVGQILAGNNPQQAMPQPSPTGSNGSLPARRSPPTTSRISPAAAKLSSAAHMSPNSRGEHTPDRAREGGMSRKDCRKSNVQTNSRVSCKGRRGVAYAGGAASSTLHLQHSVATVKDPAVERVRATDRSSPKEVDNSLKRQVREKERDSPKTRERSQTTSSASSQLADAQPLGQRTPEYRGSPPFHTPLASPSERSAAYGQYIPDSYQQQPASVPPQAVPRKPVPVLNPEATPLRTTPPGVQKIPGQPQPSLPVNARATDRALPLQEEPEEDIGHEFPEQSPEYDDRHHGSPTPSSDVYPDGHASRYDDRREHGSNRSHSESDDETLNEEVQEKLHQKSEGEESSGFTPRSPTTNLPERPSQGQYSPSTANAQYNPAAHVPYSQATIDNQKTVRAKHRVPLTDQVGMRNLDPALFDQNSIKSNGSNGVNSSHGRTHSLPEQGFPDHYQNLPKELSPSPPL